ncbi:MAG: SDR family NAD(P)-dependent oxidoreductase [Chloroflexi bacterium]|nr:SDR family NAD(P)-dependent oxidoreductase [Chloroflexota bacterium]
MPNETITRLLDLRGQVVLITGANRGIGKAIAEVFGAAGARLALVARTAATLEAVADQLRQSHPLHDPSQPTNETVLALPADVAVEAQVNATVQRVIDVWGRIDVLVNNAGLISFGPYTEVDLGEWERIIGANLTGAYLYCRAVAPWMERQHHGAIINISSVSAYTGGVSGSVHYATSKGGMISMTKTLARDLAPHGVTVNAIAPGQIDADPNLLTDEARERVLAMIPLGRLGEPNDIAYAALFLASPMAAYITGATLDVNGGILKR